MKIGEKIRIAREARGWSTHYLAKLAGISQPAIVNIESGATVKSKHEHEIKQILGIDGPEFAKIATSVAGPPVPLFTLIECEQGVLIMGRHEIAVMERTEDLPEASGAYGVYMAGYSMAPRYRPGEVLIVNPSLPARTEDGAVFRQPNSDGVLIAEFVRSTGTDWIVRVFGDHPRELTISRAEWPICHTICGTRTRR